MKKLLSIFLFVFLGLNTLQAQEQDSIVFPPEYFVYQDSLQELMQDFNLDSLAFNRLKANYQFIRLLVQTLKIDNSYQFPFDSLQVISIVEPEDKAFRIFSWQVQLDKATYRHFGCIQMNQPDLKMQAFVDMSDSLSIPQDTILDKNTWFGAVYYQIKMQKHRGKKYYTLFGFDAHEPFSSRKIIDVLTLDKKKNNLQFGAAIFQTPEGLKNRMVYEFKKRVAVTVAYSEQDKIILLDHLAPSENGFENMYFNYVPDGTYNAFRWKKGKWNFEENINLQKLRK